MAFVDLDEVPDAASNAAPTAGFRVEDGRPGVPRLIHCAWRASGQVIMSDPFRVYPLCLSAS